MTQFLRLGARAHITPSSNICNTSHDASRLLPSSIRLRAPRVDEYIPNHRSCYPTWAMLPVIHPATCSFRTSGIPSSRTRAKLRRSPCTNSPSHNICESHPQTHPSFRRHLRRYVCLAAKAIEHTRRKAWDGMCVWTVCVRTAPPTHAALSENASALSLAKYASAEACLARLALLLSGH